MMEMRLLVTARGIDSGGECHSGFDYPFRQLVANRQTSVQHAERAAPAFRRQQR